MVHPSAGFLAEYELLERMKRRRRATKMVHLSLSISSFDPSSIPDSLQIKLFRLNELHFFSCLIRTFSKISLLRLERFDYSDLIRIENSLSGSAIHPSIGSQRRTFESKLLS